jgi:hypothetical protein
LPRNAPSPSADVGTGDVCRGEPSPTADVGQGVASVSVEGLCAHEYQQFEVALTACCQWHQTGQALSAACRRVSEFQRIWPIEMTPMVRPAAPGAGLVPSAPRGVRERHSAPAEPARAGQNLRRDPGAAWHDATGRIRCAPRGKRRRRRACGWVLDHPRASAGGGRMQAPFRTGRCHRPSTGGLRS